MSGRPLLIATGIYAILCIVSPTHISKFPRVYAPETSALKAIQTLNTAQVQYNSQFGRYARSLIELGPSAASLIPADLAAGEKQGYKFTLTGTPGGYTIHAVPTVFGTTGSRTFYTNQSLVIRENYDPKPATASSPEVGSAVATTGGTK